MSIRLICSDVDGTILPRGGEISERTRAAVHALGEKGVPFVIASGRWYVAAKDIADQLELADGVMIIANGGAVVRMDGTPLWEWTMTGDEAARAYGVLLKYDVMRNAFVRSAVYRENTRAYRAMDPGLTSYLGGACSICNDDRERFEREGLSHPYKLEAYSNDEPTMAALRAELTAAGFEVTSAYWNNLEIQSRGAGKGAAVRWLAQQMGAAREEILTLGDNTNDLPMLQASGWPVAMENGVDELKRAARLIAPDCADDGAAQILEKVLRGEIG